MKIYKTIGEKGVVQNIFLLAVCSPYFGVSFQASFIRKLGLDVDFRSVDFQPFHQDISPYYP